jgi:N-acetylmuramoyl-L-alanine amidase
MQIVISSGHGKYIRGASGSPVPPQLDEVDEARRMVERIADYARQAGVEVTTFHDNSSHDQGTNLETIVYFHNSQGSHDLDVSVHFNAFDGSAHGTEVLYVTQEDLADEVCDAIVEAGGFTNRGAKYRGDLYFLNNTNEPAILLETAFCDNTGDSNAYNQNFDAICQNIAEAIAGRDIIPIDPPVDIEEPPPDVTGENRVEINGTVQGNVSVFVNGELVRGDARGVDAVSLRITTHGDVTVTLNGQDLHNPPPPVLVNFNGKVSWFGGPEDMGVSPSEGLAFLFEVEDAPHLFLEQQPPGTTGLARRLNPEMFYVACRWDYNITPKTMLADATKFAAVRSKKTGREFVAWPGDWGPHGDTDRAADISPGLMEALGITTDDEVEVRYPVEPSGDKNA